MEKTIFQKICDHEVPGHIVYEDDYFVAFLDIHPRAPGHTLVVPRHPYRWVWDVPAQADAPGNIGDYFRVVQKIALAIKSVFGVELVRSQVFGEEVPHAHIWLWPEHATGDEADFAGNAQKIREHL